MMEPQEVKSSPGKKENTNGTPRCGTSAVESRACEVGSSDRSLERRCWKFGRSREGEAKALSRCPRKDRSGAACEVGEVQKEEELEG